MKHIKKIDEHYRSNTLEMNDMRDYRGEHKDDLEKVKARKWDELTEEVNKFYESDPDGEEGGDLIAVGEICLRHLGLL